MCVERPQHGNLFHIPKTNQAGYFHSGRGLTVEVGLTRAGGATEQHMKHLLALGTCFNEKMVPLLLLYIKVPLKSKSL